MSTDGKLLTEEFEALVGRRRMTDRVNEGAVDESARLATEKEEFRKLISEPRNRRSTKSSCNSSARSELEAGEATPQIEDAGVRDAESGRPEKTSPGLAAAVGEKSRKSERRKKPIETKATTPSFIARPDVRPDAGLGLLSPANMLAAAIIAGLGLGAAFVWRNGFSNSSVARVEASGDELATLETSTGGPDADVAARRPSLALGPASEIAPRQIDAPEQGAREREESAKKPESAPPDGSTSEPVGIFAPPDRLASAELVGTEAAPSRPSAAFFSEDKPTATAAPSVTRQASLIAPRAAKRKAEANAAPSEPPLSEAIAATSVDSSPAKRIAAPLPPSRVDALGTVAPSVKTAAVGPVVAAEEDRAVEARAEAPERRIEPNREFERASVQDALESIAGIFKGFRE